MVENEQSFGEYLRQLIKDSGITRINSTQNWVSGSHTFMIFSPGELPTTISASVKGNGNTASKQ